jgi:hypothetical protein
VIESGCQSDLGQESLPAEHCGQLGPEHLDGHFAVVLEVVGEIYRGHAAVPKLAFEHVAIAECGSEGVRRVGQGTDPPGDGSNLLAV